MNDLASEVQRHYSGKPILPLIQELLRCKGIAEDQVRPEHLYPFDQSHAGGTAAIQMLADRVGIGRDALVADIGCGYGCASRWLHAERGCRVVGVDLTPARIETAAQLTRMVRFQSSVHFAVGSAMSLPLASSTAEFVWTQHVTMNVPDHASLLGECSRVLKPSGRLASHEWLRRGDGELSYPLPWAYAAPLNHAIQADRFFDLLKENGFAVEAEEVTQPMRDSLSEDATRMETAGQPPERVAAIRNLVQAAGDGLFGCYMIVARKD